MTVNTYTISQNETAFLLRAKLGPIRAWNDFLSDNIRGRQSIHGETLMPCSRKKHERGWRPMYAVKDVDEFIAKVLALEPKAGKVPVTPIVLAVDHRKPWWLNKFDETGAPVAMLRRVSGHIGSAAAAH